jgi:hypothetical protein
VCTFLPTTTHQGVNFDPCHISCRVPTSTCTAGGPPKCSTALNCFDQFAKPPDGAIPGFPQYSLPAFPTYYPLTLNWYDDSFCEHNDGISSGSNWIAGDSDSFRYTRYGSLRESTYLWFHTNLIQRTDCMQAGGADFAIRHASSYNYKLNGSPGSLVVNFLSRTINTETEGWFTITPCR